MNHFNDLAREVRTIGEYYFIFFSINIDRAMFSDNLPSLLRAFLVYFHVVQSATRSYWRCLLPLRIPPRWSVNQIYLSYELTQLAYP